jgi:hypothetical protein
MRQQAETQRREALKQKQFKRANAMRQRRALNSFTSKQTQSVKVLRKNFQEDQTKLKKKMKKEKKQHKQAKERRKAIRTRQIQEIRKSLKKKEDKFTKAGKFQQVKQQRVQELQDKNLEKFMGHQKRVQILQQHRVRHVHSLLGYRVQHLPAEDVQTAREVRDSRLAEDGEQEIPAVSAAP